jgi:hypothetical protein
LIEWQADLDVAFKRGSIIVARRFADIFSEPSLVWPTLSDAMARGKTVHCVDLGDLSAIMPQLRVIAAAFAPLETRIQALGKQIEDERVRHAAICNEVGLIAVRRTLEKQLGSTITDATREATERANAPKQAMVDALVAEATRIKRRAATANSEA